jgi:hypothetical protein
MLLPQHWAQVSNDIRGTSSTTFGDIMVLRWNKMKYQKIIPICPRGTNNEGIMSSPAGINKYLHLCDTNVAAASPLAFSSIIDLDDTQEQSYQNQKMREVIPANQQKHLT